MTPYLFVHSPLFDRSASDVLTDDGLREIQDAIRADPRRGNVIPGTSGVRKMRWSLPGSGKSGGVRVLYLFVPEHGRVHLILVYPKNRKENITEAERMSIRRIAELVKLEGHND